jgi:transcriptional regulator with XRE-family HTH domain
MYFVDRLNALGRRKGIWRGNLAERVEVHFTQVSCYERGGTYPNAEAMTIPANALDTTICCLMNKSAGDLVLDAGLENELISCLKEV